jgi:hypothetical protein
MKTTMMKFGMGMLGLTAAMDPHATTLETALAAILGIGLILMALLDIKKENGFD